MNIEYDKESLSKVQQKRKAVRSEINWKISCYKHRILLVLSFESQTFSESWACHTDPSIYNYNKIKNIFVRQTSVYQEHQLNSL